MEQIIIEMIEKAKGNNDYDLLTFARNKECDWKGLKAMKITKVQPSGWKAEHEGKILYFGEYGKSGCNGNEGVTYKDEEAFKSGNGICYIPEYGFENEDEDLIKAYAKEFSSNEIINNSYVSISGYTRTDLIELCGGNERKAEILFEYLDWMFPETLIDEWDREGVFDE